MVATQRRRRTRKKSQPKSAAVAGAANTFPGLPYFTLDKALESELDKSPSSLKKLPRAAKQRLAVKLRLAGASYDQIAEKLGYKNPESVSNLVSKVIAESYELSEDEITELVKADLMRLDAMQLVMWEKATRYGDEKAVDRVVNLMQERRKLLGIEDKNRGGDGSVSVHITGENARTLVVGGGEQDFIDQLRELRGEAPVELNGHKDEITAEVIKDEENNDG